MGAHPNAPSSVIQDGQEAPLHRFIAKDPEAVLGPRVQAKFGDELPFLFKILAAGSVLSIQCHPNAEQARAGFQREEALGIARDAKTRSYKDPHPKPELIVALTDFTAMKGFRPYAEVLAFLETLGIRALLLPEPPDTEPEGLQAILANMLRLDGEAKAAILVRLRELFEGQSAAPLGEPPFSWIPRLMAEHPEDLSVLSPLLLHGVELKPGEALYLPAGELHAYVEGLGLELMRSSDNVLRGGLTPKHIDIDELMRILVFRSSPPEILLPVEGASQIPSYPTPAEAFRLSVLEPGEGHRHQPSGPEILLALRGSVQLRRGGTHLTLAPGESALAFFDGPPLECSGDGELAIASVP